MKLNGESYADYLAGPNAPKGHKKSPLPKMQTKDGLEEPAEKARTARKFDSADGKIHYTVFE